MVDVKTEEPKVETTEKELDFSDLAKLAREEIVEEEKPKVEDNPEEKKDEEPKPEEDPPVKPEEEKPAEEEPKPEEEKKPEEKEGDGEPEAKDDFETTLVKRLMEETTMEEADAREIVEKEKNLAESFKVPFNKDTQELLKSKRHADATIKELSEKSKLLEQNLQHFNATQDRSVDYFKNIITSGEACDNTGKKFSADEVVKQYETYDPQLANKMKDTLEEGDYKSQIIELAARSMKTVWDGNQKEYVSNLKTNAKGKRIEILQNLPEEHKEFLPDIKKHLLDYSDDFILQPTFDVKNVVHIIRGGKPYDDLKASVEDRVKKAREEAFKSAKEQKKIVSVNTSQAGSAGKTSTEKTGGAFSTSLSDSEKQIAIKRFSNMSEEDACELYLEHKKLKQSKEKKE